MIGGSICFELIQFSIIRGHFERVPAAKDIEVNETARLLEGYGLLPGLRPEAVRGERHNGRSILHGFVE